jgi:ABC-2 type transport system ATP-binding protein
MTPPILRATRLCKTFRIPLKSEGWRDIFSPKHESFDAVKNLDLSIRPGEKVAFLGPNGAGKSTAIKMFCGILAPSGGQLEVCGLDPLGDRGELTYLIGAVFGQVSKLYYHLTPIDTYKLLGKMYDVPNEQLRKRLDYLFESFQMRDLLHIPVRKLSLGQRMRAELVASLIHSPKILFLDEPTIGLDMIAKANLRDVINTINRTENTTILLTSHDIGDIEEICDRVVIINHGSVVFDGSLHDLKTEHVKEKYVSLRFDAATAFKPKPDMTILDSDPFRVTFSIPNRKEILKETLAHVIETYEIEDISVTEPDTESIIKGFYQ